MEGEGKYKINIDDGILEHFDANSSHLRAYVLPLRRCSTLGKYNLQLNPI